MNNDMTNMNNPEAFTELFLSLIETASFDSMMSLANSIEISGDKELSQKIKALWHMANKTPEAIAYAKSLIKNL